MPATLQIAEVADGVRALTLSHPERKNALDAGFLDALEQALINSTGVRAWLVRSVGDVFSAGYDLTALNGFPEGTPLPDERLGVVLDRLMHHPAPSVALVSGIAVGAGCELAAACDFRVGNSAARFSMPPAKLGVVYALKGLRRLSSRVGEQAARRMFLTGRVVSAEEALRLGLLDVLSDDQAEGEALGLCQELARNAPLAVKGMKRGFELLGGGNEADLAGYEILRRASFNSSDVREGKEALMSRRAPVFKGE
jgi:enoyl-CoA hydratase/carnithine racemase